MHVPQRLHASNKSVSFTQSLPTPGIGRYCAILLIITVNYRYLGKKVTLFFLVFVNMSPIFVNVNICPQMAQIYLEISYILEGDRATLSVLPYDWSCHIKGIAANSSRAIAVSSINLVRTKTFVLLSITSPKPCISIFGLVVRNFSAQARA